MRIISLFMYQSDFVGAYVLLCVRVVHGHNQVHMMDINLSVYNIYLFNAHIVSPAW